MRRIPLGWIVWLAAMLAAPAALFAQTPFQFVDYAERSGAVADRAGPLRGGSGSESLANRAVTLEMEGATLDQVLTEIGRQSGFRLMYGEDVLALSHHVSLRLRSAGMEEALRRGLQGTGLQPRYVSPDAILIKRGPVPMELAQRQSTLTGRVTDETTQQPLSGAQVVVVGTQLGTITGTNGTYRIADVPAGEQRVRAVMVGYATHEKTVQITAGETAILDLQLQPRAIQLEGVVAVGYGTRRRETLTGSVSAVSGDVIETAPVVNTSNAIGGRMPGVVAVTGSGEPGNDGSSIRIRGNHTLNNNSPLVVIDGVPNRSGGFDRISPQDIESISVLKDASAAIYGAQAANGVILVTTKRGSEAQPQLTLDFNQGFNQPTRIPRMADAATYLTMLNEIELYRGRAPVYSAEQIQRYREGGDPWFYPDTDWFSEALKPVSMQSRGHMQLSGGSDRMRYFLSMGGLTEDGYYRNSATRYNQANFRSNIDGQITDNLSLRFDVAGRFEDRNFPTQSAGATFRMLMRSKPHLPAFWPNGLPGPDIEFGQNPVVTGTDATGYNNDERYFLQGNLSLDLKVPGVDGLTLRGNAAYDKDFRTQKNWQTPWTLYTWDYNTRDANGEPVLVPGQRGFSEPRLYRRHEDGNNILLNLIGEYRTSFGAHSMNLLAGVERQQFDNTYFDAFRRYYISDQIPELFAGGEAERTNNGSSTHGARQNYFARANYDYQSKYLLEFIGRYDGSYIFPASRRYGFFPAVSAGWRLSEEPFFRNAVPFFNDLKLRASWGQTGNDRIDEWQYLTGFRFSSGYVVGVDRDVTTLFQARTPNPNVTWEVANQRNIGLDGAVLDNRLYFEVDYFNNLRTDILHFRNASVPQTSGLTLPRENIGEVASWGFDGSLSWRQNLRDDVSYNITFAGGYAQNKIRFWDEPEGAPEWQRSTGFPMNTGLYYEAIGVFRDEADLERFPHWPGARPGDVIFRDVDGDGRITANDRVRVNRSGTPTFTGGLSLDTQLRQFDVSVFFRGAAGAVQYVKTESGDLGNYFAEFAENRWTPDKPSSKHPRTFNGNEEYWMAQDNTYFLRSTDYVRLATLQLGYSLPPQRLSGLGLQNLRLYVSGFNLLTWDKFGLMDPESQSQSGAYYPQKRVFNAGASVAF
jgi:TonB-dependent starch-binding outer membrane protein SusC